MSYLLFHLFYNVIHFIILPAIDNIIINKGIVIENFIIANLRTTPHIWVNSRNFRLIVKTNNLANRFLRFVNVRAFLFETWTRKSFERKIVFIS